MDDSAFNIRCIEEDSFVYAQVSDGDWTAVTKRFATYIGLLVHVSEVISARKAALRALGARGEVP